MNFIKNKILNIFIITSLSVSAVNIHPFSLSNFFKKPKNVNAFLKKSKNAIADWAKKNEKTLFITTNITIFLGIITIPFTFILIKMILYDNKLIKTCIICDESNENCICNLGEKIIYAFNHHGFLKKLYYYNNIPTYSDCEWKHKEIQSILAKIHNINMKLSAEDGSNSITILHLACLYGHEPTITWLVEKMFVDINIADGHGNLPADILEKQTPYYRCKINNFYYKEALFHNIDNYFLRKKMRLQEKLLGYVEYLKGSLTETPIHLKTTSKLKKMKTLIYSKKTPGFAKQLIMSDLIFIHKNSPEYITKKDIESFYKHIAFNYTFLHDTRFAKAVEFAKTNGIGDIYGRTIAQAHQIYKEENKGIKTILF